jgi:hypothetical protein
MVTWLAALAMKDWLEELEMKDKLRERGDGTYRLALGLPKAGDKDILVFRLVYRLHTTNDP